MAGLLLPPPRESAIQTQVVQYARLTGWTVWEMFTGSARGGSVFCTKGLPDLYMFRPGVDLFMELKRGPLGRVSAAQHDRHAELTAAGRRLYVCRSFDEAKAVLDELRGRERVGSDIRGGA